MALPAFVVFGAGEAGEGSVDVRRRGYERRRWMGARRQHSDSGEFPFRFKRAGKGLFVRIGVE